MPLRVTILPDVILSNVLSFLNYSSLKTDEIDVCTIFGISNVMYSIPRLAIQLIDRILISEPYGPSRLIACLWLCKELIRKIQKEYSGRELDDRVVLFSGDPELISRKIHRMLTAVERIVACVFSHSWDAEQHFLKKENWILFSLSASVKSRFHSSLKKSSISEEKSTESEEDADEKELKRIVNEFHDFKQHRDLNFFVHFREKYNPQHNESLTHSCQRVLQPHFLRENIPFLKKELWEKSEYSLSDFEFAISNFRSLKFLNCWTPFVQKFHPKKRKETDADGMGDDEEESAMKKLIYFSILTKDEKNLEKLRQLGWIDIKLLRTKTFCKCLCLVNDVEWMEKVFELFNLTVAKDQGLIRILQKTSLNANKYKLVKYIIDNSCNTFPHEQLSDLLLSNSVVAKWILNHMNEDSIIEFLKKSTIPFFFEKLIQRRLFDVLEHFVFFSPLVTSVIADCYASERNHVDSDSLTRTELLDFIASRAWTNMNDETPGWEWTADRFDIMEWLARLTTTLHFPRSISLKNFKSKDAFVRQWYTQNFKKEPRRTRCQALNCYVSELKKSVLGTGAVHPSWLLFLEPLMEAGVFRDCSFVPLGVFLVQDDVMTVRFFSHHAKKGNVHIRMNPIAYISDATNTHLNIYSPPVINAMFKQVFACPALKHCVRAPHPNQIMAVLVEKRVRLPLIKVFLTNFSSLLKIDLKGVSVPINSMIRSRQMIQKQEAKIPSSFGRLRAARTQTQPINIITKLYHFKHTFKQFKQIFWLEKQFGFNFSISQCHCKVDDLRKKEKKEKNNVCVSSSHSRSSSSSSFIYVGPKMKKHFKRGFVHEESKMKTNTIIQRGNQDLQPAFVERHCCAETTELEQNFLSRIFKEFLLTSTICPYFSDAFIEFLSWWNSKGFSFEVPAHFKINVTSPQPSHKCQQALAKVNDWLNNTFKTLFPNVVIGENLKTLLRKTFKTGSSEKLVEKIVERKINPFVDLDIFKNIAPK